MTQTSDCPACGAPLDYTGNADVIRCGFCDTELTVNHTGSGPRFQVLGTPSPQAQVLADQNQRVIGEAAVEAASELPGEGPGARVYDTGQPQPPDPFDLPPSPPPGGPSRAYEVPPTSTVRSGDSMRILGMDLPRWLVIVIAVVLGLCLLCVCGIAAIVAAGIPVFSS